MAPVSLSPMMAISSQSDERLWAAITTHTRSIRGLIVAFIWGLGEGTLFFIVPDVYLGIVALFNPRRLLPVLAASLAGAGLGGLLMFSWGRASPSSISVALARVPLVSPDMVAQTFHRVDREGLWAMLDAPWLGVPYKVYAAGAGAADLPLGIFVPISLVARLERFLPIIAAAGLLGTRLGKPIRRHARLAVASYAVFWLLIYLAYYIYVAP